MINKLNLSSNPFRNRTLPYVITLLLLAVAVGGTVLAFASLSDANKRNEIVKTEIGEMFPTKRAISIF